MKRYKFEEDYDVSVTESLEFEELIIGYTINELYDKYFKNNGGFSIELDNINPYESHYGDIYNHPTFKTSSRYEYSGKWLKNQTIPPH